MKKKNKKTKSQKAFTIVEIVTVVTIIAILVGILLPAIAAVKRTVLDTRQEAQITTIGLAIQAFKNDYGDYPQSNWFELSHGRQDYCGAQMLAEALLGWDLLGFHPKSEWDSRGQDQSNQMVYKTDNSFSNQVREQNIRERIGPYLERAETKVFHLGDYGFQNPQQYQQLWATDGYIISDVYSYEKITDISTGKRVMTGLPVLYYKAKRQFKQMDKNNPQISIYDFQDNHNFIKAISQEDIYDKKRVNPHKLYDYEYFYEDYTRDPKIGDKNRPWPYRPDSYLLISAGYDGEYGTEDDITNFK